MQAILMSEGFMEANRGEGCVRDCRRGRKIPRITVKRSMPRISIRTLAREIGLSTATISLALRDSTLVLPETRERVQQAAARAGYRANPLVGSVMSSLRRAADASYHGSLLAIEYS